MSQQIHTDKAPQFALPFSQALRAGDFVYVSGQVGVYPESKELAGPTIEEQTEQSLRNIQAILAAAGLTLDHVVKVNAHVSDLDLFPGFNRAYERLFKAPYPCRTTVKSGLGNYLVEVDVIAYAGSRRGE